MKLIRLFSVSLLVLAIGTVATRAQPFRVVNCSPTPPVHHVATTPHFRDLSARRAVVELIQVAQLNPAYSSAYAPDSYDAASQAEILATIKQLSAQVDALRLLAAAKAVPPGTVVVPPVVPPVVVPGAPPKLIPGTDGVLGLSVFQAKCAACHQTGKMLPDQRFALLDARGNLVTLTAAQKLKVIQKTYHAEMPPPVNIHSIQPLTDAEFAAILTVMR